jgi:hypothetical protein
MDVTSETIAHGSRRTGALFIQATDVDGSSGTKFAENHYFGLSEILKAACLSFGSSNKTNGCLI